MKAIIQRRYGTPDVLEYGDVDVPEIGDDEVRVRVRAAGVDPGVWFCVSGKPFVVRAAVGLSKPRHSIPGRAMAGHVEAVGKNASRFQPDDEVYGELTGGAYAEYVAAPEKVLARKPANLTFEQAAAVPLSAATALQGVRDKGRTQPGQHVLVNGASGGVGTFAVQIAKALGAEVTGVCSGKNADLVGSLGADHVVDYALEDFTESGQRYDVVFDLIGNHSLRACRRALAPNGRLVLSSGPPSPVIRRLLAAVTLSPFMQKKMVPLLQTPNSDDLETLTQLVEAGAVTPVIDRTYPLHHAAEALRRQGEGHMRGKTVITI